MRGMPKPETMPLAHSFVAFPKEGLTWEVIMYGQLHASLMGQGIEILLADAEWRRTNGIAPPILRLFRPLGDVAGLPIGSRWTDGRSAPANDEVETIEIDVPALDGWPDHRLGEAHFVAGKRPAYPIVGLQDAPVWRIPVGDKSYFVPAAEVIRATFGSTTDFLRLAIEGGLDLGPSKRRMIFDLKASGPDRMDPRVLRVKANRKLHRREAESVGRILTNDRMRQSFRQVFASLQRAQTNGWPKYPTTIFPFDHPTRWKVDIVWTRINSGSRRCLVTRIRSIKTLPLAFDKVFVELKGGAGELEPGEHARPMQASASEGKKVTIKIHPDRIPIASIATTDLNGGHTSHDPGFELEHIVVDATGRQTTMTVETEDDEPLEMGSTWWASGKHGRAVGVSFQSSVVDYDDSPRTAGALLDSTRQALELLARKKSWDCEILSPHFGCGADPVDGLYRYPPESGGRQLAWSHMRNGRLRRALVMRLMTPRGIIYAIDAERREVTEGQALGLILTSTRDNLDYVDIADILSINATNRGVWSGSTQGRITNKRPRNPTWYTNLSAYSTGLSETTHALLSGVPV